MELVKLFDVVRACSFLEEGQPFLEDFLVFKEKCENSIPLRNKVGNLGFSSYVTLLSSKVKLNRVDFRKVLSVF